MTRTWCRRASAILVALAAALVLVCAMAAGASGDSLVGVKCTPMTGDPQIEAPSYAQANGANGTNDGWWCQLPHATQIPAGLVQRRRFFIPAETTPAEVTNYGNYWTWYAAPSKGKATATAAPTPAHEGVVVADLVYSESNPPTHLLHMKLPKGTRVQVVRGVVGIETVKRTTVRVTFRFPTKGKGVPKYLTSVATVTVIGWHVPAATVLAVARHIKPL